MAVLTIYVGERKDGDYQAAFDIGRALVSRRLSGKSDMENFVNEYALLVRKRANGDTGRLVNFSGDHTGFISGSYGDRTPKIPHMDINNAPDETLATLSLSDDDLRKFGLYVEPTTASGRIEKISDRGLNI